MQRRAFLTGLTGLLASQTFSVYAAPNTTQDFELLEGVQYKLVPEPQPTAPYPKKVVEVFGYGCPHCYHLEPSIHKWLKTKPKDIHFERMPVVFNNPNWIFMARVFFTAQELGVVEQSHTPFFDALHRDKKPLFTVKAIAKFFTQFGVKEEDFISTFKGFKVEQLVQHAAKLTKDYGVEGVPSIIVNGKYLTDVGMNGNRDNMWKTVTELANK